MLDMQVRNNGFTLIELLVTMIVMAIVIGIALPSFNTMMQDNRAGAQASEFQSALAYARAEAIRQAGRVSICPSSDGATCLTAADWAKGWMVFTDSAIFDSTAEATVGAPIKFWGNLHPKTEMKGLMGLTPSLTHVRFTSTGLLARTNAADAVVRSFELSMTGCTGDSKYRVVVGISGMLSTSKILCD
jgi:type IV fimbrial biogenesis protein FimT